MGVRKRNSAEKRKEAQKNIAFAKLTNIPSSPRKMRLVADMVRGVEVFRALGLLKFSNKDAAVQLEKLLRSAVANWEAKNDQKAEKTACCASPPSPWAALLCSSVCVPLPRAVATVSANVPTT